MELYCSLGVGIIVMAMAMLPIFSVEHAIIQNRAFDTPDKVLPRAAQIAGGYSQFIYL